MDNPSRKAETMTPTKQNLIDAGLALYRDNGMLAVTMSAASKDAKTSRQTAHQYFENIETFREAVLSAARVAAKTDDSIRMRLKLDRV
jgi:AcrR family transcriptional regulator